MDKIKKNIFSLPYQSDRVCEIIKGITDERVEIVNIYGGATGDDVTSCLYTFPCTDEVFNIIVKLLNELGYEAIKD
ncbi:hypothetical protein ACNNMU_01210 [Aerococcus viridans]